MKRALLGIAIISCGVAHAGCRELAAAIEDGQKEIANQTARMGSERASEASARARIAAELQAITVNVQLLERAKCPALMEPVSADGAPYLRAASRCLAPGGGPETCDRATWTRAK